MAPAATTSACPSAPPRATSRSTSAAEIAALSPAGSLGAAALVYKQETAEFAALARVQGLSLTGGLSEIRAVLSQMIKIMISLGVWVFPLNNATDLSKVTT